MENMMIAAFALLVTLIGCAGESPTEPTPSHTWAGLKTLPDDTPDDTNGISAAHKENIHTGETIIFGIRHNATDADKVLFYEEVKAHIEVLVVLVGGINDALTNENDGSGVIRGFRKQLANTLTQYKQAFEMLPVDEKTKRVAEYITICLDCELLLLESEE